MVNRDLKNIAYDLIKKKIINCEYKPGSLINETQLAKELDFSRTPIRQALNGIEQEGFIETLPKKGIYVKPVTLAMVRQVFQTRILMEPLTLKMAAPFLPKDKLQYFKDGFLGKREPVDFSFDTEMHLFFIENCGNSYIIKMMKKVFDENTRIIISSGQNKTKIHDAQSEHLEILDLLLEEKFEIAQEKMHSHIEACKRAALDYFYQM
ncbi:MAG: GntR family transcriptional regulator [Sphaerochaetaceae bacterium]